MESLTRFLEEIPFIYRYAVSLFFGQLLIVLIVLTVLSSALVSVAFLNMAKVVSLKNLFLYVFSSIAVFFAFFFPIFVFLAALLSLYLLIRRKLNLVIFTLGVEPKKFVIPFSVVGLFLSLLLLLYFQTVYPYAGYTQHIAYLKGKKKPINTGIVQNFWYRIGSDKFLNFKLVNLKEKKAYDGSYFKVSPDFKIVWFSEIPKADFRVSNDKIEVEAKNITTYSGLKVENIEHLKLKLPYDEKLLKVKKPSYFSLSELLKLTLTAKYYGVNFYPYLWELEKRILIAAFTALITVLSFAGLMKSVKVEEFFRNSLKLFLSIAVFYVVLLLYQTAVDKVSLNPLYVLAGLFPYLFWLWRVWD